MSRYIDADNLKTKLHRWDEAIKLMPSALAEIQQEIILEMEKHVDETKTEDVAPIVRGKWKWKELHGIDYCYCSICKSGQWEMEFNYCPNCGAKMKKQ